MKVHTRWHWPAVHRPRLAWYWSSDTSGWLTLSWGDRYGDPVWGIDLEITRISRWLLRLDERIRARRKVRTP